MEKIIETLIEQNFILIEERNHINKDNYSSSYRLLDMNRNYVNSLGKRKYASKVIEEETLNVKSEDELIKWLNNKDRKIEDLSNQDKRNIISMKSFTFKVNNGLDYFYYLNSKDEIKQKEIENKRFSSLDEAFKYVISFSEKN